MSSGKKQSKTSKKQEEEKDEMVGREEKKQVAKWSSAATKALIKLVAKLGTDDYSIIHDLLLQKDASWDFSRTQIRRKVHEPDH